MTRLGIEPRSSGPLANTLPTRLIHSHNHNDIHPTVHIQIQIQIQYKGGLHCSGTNAFINFLTSVLRHEERDTILTMLTILSDPLNAQRILWCLRSRSVEICKTPTGCLNGRELNSLCPNGRDHIYLSPWQKIHFLPAWSNVNLQLTLFQNPQILRTISSRHDVHPHFLSGVHYDNGDCHILFARA